MRTYTRVFITLSLVYALIAAALGIYYLLLSGGYTDHGLLSPYPLIVSTIHTLFLGFFTMMIFGVTYHIIPIFSGRDFFRISLVYLHLIISNAGVIGMIVFLLSSRDYPAEIEPMVWIASMIEVSGILVFMANITLAFLKGSPATGIVNPFGEGDRKADLIAIRFTGTSITYFLGGSIIGVIMLLRPDIIHFARPAHAHINLIGFISIMISGVSYHMFPRFANRPLHSISLARLQFRMVNIGLLGMVLTFLFAVREGYYYRLLLPIFSAITAFSFILYIYNSWKTIRDGYDA